MTWYKHWFADDLYTALYAHRDAAEARLAVDLFERATSATPGDAPVLDLACGTGRHAFELVRRGYAVLAADLSPTLLAAARRKTRRYEPHLQFVRADMRALPFATRSFAAVLQLFTAFGYFETDEENAAVIRGTTALLRPGGWYVLDYLNPSQLRSNLPESSTRRINHRTVTQERKLTASRIIKRITIEEDEQVKTYTESVRLFTLDDFHGMFGSAGAAIVHVYGDYDGSPYCAQSPRCVMIARRSA